MRQHHACCGSVRRGVLLLRGRRSQVTGNLCTHAFSGKPCRAQPHHACSKKPCAARPPLATLPLVRSQAVRRGSSAVAVHTCMQCMHFGGPVQGAPGWSPLCCMRVYTTAVHACRGTRVSMHACMHAEVQESAADALVHSSKRHNRNMADSAGARVASSEHTVGA
jgi:hypothetical protein